MAWEDNEWRTMRCCGQPWRGGVDFHEATNSAGNVSMIALDFWVPSVARRTGPEQLLDTFAWRLRPSMQFCAFHFLIVSHISSFFFLRFFVPLVISTFHSSVHLQRIRGFLSALMRTFSYIL